MKWPESLTLVRHDRSAYNALRPLKDASPTYTSFKRAYNRNPESKEAQELALQIKDEFSLSYGDHNTPLARGEGYQAETMATSLKNLIPVPDIIFVSPYERTQDTLSRMKIGWPELNDVRVVEEERIREQEHGLTLLYNDWRVFHVLNPEQMQLDKLQGRYWYRYPNGENVPDVRERLRSWLTTLTRDFSEQNVLSVTHHLAILSLRANIERLGEREFLRLDHEEKPINAGVTIYRGDPSLGQDGRLVLNAYNVQLYPDSLTS